LGRFGPLRGGHEIQPPFCHDLRPPRFTPKVESRERKHVHAPAHLTRPSWVYSEQTVALSCVETSREAPGEERVRRKFFMGYVGRKLVFVVTFSQNALAPSKLNN